jgi:hypothetical protein
LNERKAYVRIQFKVPQDEDPAEYQLVFHIQGGVPSRGPYTAVGASLPPPVDGSVTGAPVEAEIKAADVPWASHVINAVTGPDRPYDNLLWAMYQGEQSDFVGTNGTVPVFGQDFLPEDDIGMHGCC